MWLVLDDSLIEVDPLDGNLRAALEQLLYAVSRGEHALATSPNVARHLLKGDYSPVPRTILRQALDRAPELLAFQKAARYWVRIVADGDQVSRFSDSVWDIPIEWVRVNGVPNSCILGENTRDSQLFMNAALHYKTLNRKAFQLRIDLASGGGADTPGVLTEAIKSRRNFLLCITDSDKKCLCAPSNRTSADCARISNDPSWVSTHVGLAEREVENALPLNIVADTVDSMGPSELDQRFADLQAVASVHGQAWGLFDLKEGTSLRSMFVKCCGYWAAFRAHPTCISGSRAECLAANACLAPNKDACECRIAPPLGPKIVDHVLKYLGENSVHAAAKRVSTSANATVWLEIGSLVYSWGVSMPKLRS